MDGRERGIRGEQLAARHYKADGYHLVTSNYRTRYGEVDLILEKDGMLVFAEVKTRGRKSIAAPREWVDARKQRRLILTAQQYLSQVVQREPFVRFDVVEVAFFDNKVQSLNRIENAFMP